jgi:hypothetical protein
MQQFCRPCLFCDERVGSSEEHVFGKWMGKVLGKRSGQNTSFNAMHKSASRHEYLKHKVRQGDVLSKRLKGVCEACNNGWMSVIENATKPIAEPLLLMKAKQLSLEEQRTLSCWLMLKTMVVELHVDGHRAISDALRKTFRVSLSLVPYTQIYIGTYNGKQSVEFNGFLALDCDDPANARPDTYIAFWVLGPLFAVVLWSRDEGCEYKFPENMANRLRELAPDLGNELAMPDCLIIDDDCYRETVSSFKNWAGSRSDNREPPERPDH